MKPYYWIKEKCQEEALKYNNKSEFAKNAIGAYTSSRKNGWIDEVCFHMKPCGNYIKRCIYVYEFSDNHAYVGLTYNIEKRHKNRLNNNTDSVTKHINDTGINPLRKQLTEYIDVEKAIKLEEYYVNDYIENGWIILNRAKTGCIGGNILKWTFEKCKEEALKYKYITEFKEKSNGAYERSYYNNWLDEICSHMAESKYIRWTFEMCRDEALKYNSRVDFQKNMGSSYNCALKNNWLNDICEHMISLRCSWNKIQCQEEALKYNSRSSFEYNSHKAYKAALYNNWLNEICSHMTYLVRLKWTKEQLHEEALKYNSKNEFAKKYKGAYNVACKNGWLEEITQHMKSKNKI